MLKSRDNHPRIPSKIPIHPWSTLVSPTPLASGTTTVIYRCLLNAQPIAAKLISPTLSPQSARLSATKDLLSEVAINAQLRHPHIVQFLGLAPNPLNTSSDPPALLFELAQRGKLKCEDFGPARLDKGIPVCLAIARALAHAHAVGILHRDIKPSQVLFCTGDVPKLGDWGLAKRYHGNEHCTGETGTWEYMAPEVIRSEAYDWSADVYSFGMLVHGIACGVDYPYADKYLTAAQAAVGVARNDLRASISGSVDECVREIITTCWDADAAKRPDMMRVVDMLNEAQAQVEKRKQQAIGFGSAIYNYFYG